ncbi:MAG TPA: hypothetical protein VEA99_11555 [Gemmatimonadaceae bacterium]|nr:hypothetical protein [Gemmatimonadaceae bacterium]
MTSPEIESALLRGVEFVDGARAMRAHRVSGTQMVSIEAHDGEDAVVEIAYTDLEDLLAADDVDSAVRNVGELSVELLGIWRDPHANLARRIDVSERAG